MPIHTYFFQWLILTRKQGQTDLVLVSDQGSLVGLCVQYYKSLCAAATICATLLTKKLDFYIPTPVTSNCRSNWGASMSGAPAVKIW